jgi:hypothetical protein
VLQIPAEHHRVEPAVAILTDPTGSMLLGVTNPYAHELEKLRSSPDLDGRRCQRPVPDPEAFAGVAILTSPGGPMLHLGHRDRDFVPLVAILTSPGGPVQPDAASRR